MLTQLGSQKQSFKKTKHAFRIAALSLAPQLHLFCTGSADLMSRAPYDQFLSADYGTLVRDLN